MTISRIILVSLLLFSTLSYGDGYMENLLTQKEALSSVFTKHDSFGIYTPSELEIELGFIDKFLYKDEAYDAIEELHDAGEEFLRFLEDNENEFQQLPLDKWLLVANHLLEIDDLVSRKLAWGNLVIKVAICNKIFFWMFDYIESYSDRIDAETLDKLISINKKLRSHYPSSVSMFYIAMRYSGRNVEPDITDYAMSDSYYEESKKVQGLLDQYFNDVPDGLKLAEQYLNKEQSEMSGSFVNLYDSPKPWSLFFRSNFYSISWSFYEYQMLVLKNPDRTSHEDITKEVMYDFLVNEYKGEGRLWMPTNAVNFVRKPDIYSKMYMNSVTEENTLLDKVTSDRESAKKRKSLNAREFNVSKLW